MKKPEHFCYLINSRSVSRVLRIKITGLLIALFACFLIAGVVGLARLAWFATSYTQAKLGYYQENIENEHLMLKVLFLDKFLSGETQKFNDLVAFEDNTRLEYGMDPISSDVRKAGIGGPSLSRNKNSLPIETPSILKAVEVQENLEVLLRKVQLQNATFSQMWEKVEHLHHSLEQRPSIMPVAGNVTSGFGYRPDPITGEIAFHDGYDIANEIGTPVFASADGIVKTTGFMQDYGVAVVIEHPENRIETIYAHLSNFAVHPKAQVKRGDVIGFTGNSGKSTGPHLHYEIRKNNCPVNPSSFILPEDQVID
jgi:murein DD-endopeptidase MepM/ murein hydrolase activator NlpD